MMKFGIVSHRLTSTEPPRRKLVRRALGSVSVFALAPLLMPALAQTAEQQQSAPAGLEQLGVESVIATGTRLSGFTSPTPMTTMSEQQLQDKAVTTVSEMLTDVPQLRINQNIGKSSEPVGASNADLRGLGTQRTLILIDGRRVGITDPAGTIDTNIVPVSLISSVDVVTGGASAAYGSDAVAGVVNFVLNKNLDGFKFDVSYGQTIYNDFNRPAVSFAWGKGFLGGRLHLTVAADFVHDSGQTSQAARDWGSHQTALLTNPAYTPTNGLPRLLISDSARFSQMTAGGVITRATGLNLATTLGFPAGTGVQFDPNGNPVPFHYGTNIGGVFMTGGDGASTEDAGNLMPEIERASAYGRVSYDLTSDITVFADLMYAHVPVFSDSAPNPDNGVITIRSDNAFLSPAVKAAMATRGLTSFNFGRVNFEDGFLGINSKTNVIRATFGVQGAFGDWSWDISGQLSRNSQDSFAASNRIEQRWKYGLDAVVNPANGAPICRVLLATPNASDAQDPYRDIRDCVPINPFGAGSIGLQAKSYYVGTSWYRAHMEQDVYAANLRGQPFSTWAGPVSLAVGAEYRRESTRENADASSVVSRWRSINAKPFSGEYDVKEGYAEIGIPLAKDLPFAENLDVDLAARYTDYSTSGGVWAWKIGANYSPLEDLRFRGTVSRDIRAPNNFELYSNGNQVINAIIDPRDNLARQTVQITKGNPALKPEKADTWTVGAVYEPGWLSGFSGSVDYYSIRVNHAVTTVAPQDIVNFCESGQATYCTSVIRDPGSGIISRIDIVPFNADSLKTSGEDIEAQYRFDLAGGSVTLRVLANHVENLITVHNGVSNDYVGLEGASPPPEGLPEWRWNLNASYSMGPWLVGAEYEYIAGGFIDTRYNVTNFDIANNKISGRGYVNLNASYQIDDGIQVYGRVNNLLDQDPPIAPNSITQPTVANSQFFDVRGTFFVFGVRGRF